MTTLQDIAAIEYEVYGERKDHGLFEAAFEAVISARQHGFDDPAFIPGQVYAQAHEDGMSVDQAQEFADGVKRHIEEYADERSIPGLLRRQEKLHNEYRYALASLDTD